MTDMPDTTTQDRDRLLRACDAADAAVSDARSFAASDDAYADAVRLWRLHDRLLLQASELGWYATRRAMAARLPRLAQP